MRRFEDSERQGETLSLRDYLMMMLFEIVMITIMFIVWLNAPL